MALTIMTMLTITLNYPYLFYKSEKLDVGEGFYKPVDNYLFSQDVQELNSLGSYSISNILVLNIDLL